MIKVSPLKLGPIMGHTTHESLKIWGRLSSVKNNQMLLMIEDAHGQLIHGQHVEAFKGFDNVAMVEVTGLSSASEYRVYLGRVKTDSVKKHKIQQWSKETVANLNWGKVPPTLVSTFPAPGTEVDTQFTLTSCRHPGKFKLFNRKDAMLKRMAENLDQGQRIDFRIACGDQIYADHIVGGVLPIAVPLTYSGYCKLYRRNYNSALQAVASRVPTYCTFDDHEVANDWSIGKFRQGAETGFWSPGVLDRGLLAFDTYQGLLNPNTTVDELSGRAVSSYLYQDYDYSYQFQHGMCDFFALDTRFERIEGEAFEVKKKDEQRDQDGDAFEQMISEGQLNKLLSFLKSSTANVKFVITAVPFFPDTKSSFGAPYDKWKGGYIQRKQILDEIKQHNIKNVVFLSGDVHCSLCCELDLGDEHKVYSVISSALNWPIFGLSSRNFDLGELHGARGFTSGCISRCKEGDERKADPELRNNYTHLQVRGKELTVTVYVDDDTPADTTTIALQ